MASLAGIGGRLYRGEVSIDFVGRKKVWYSISGAILAISVIAVLVWGLAFSVDFRGGSVFQFPAKSPNQISLVRSTVTAAGGGQDAIVQELQSFRGSSWQVQTRPLSAAGQTKMENELARVFHLAPNAINTNIIGPSWGGQISQKAAIALAVFLVVIVLYLSIAFEWRMAVAALIALAHDIIITVGVYALARFQVSPATVIGLLTILGYSLYDTVVVFDKVRENTAGLLGSARATYSQAANQALNQTLVRSINTSLVALLPVAAILFIGAGLLGAGELKDLALVLFVGMLSGAYSSICIATPVLADLKEREPQYKALAKRVSLRAAGGRAAKRADAKSVGGKPAGPGESSAKDAGGEADPGGADPGGADAPGGAEEEASGEPVTAGRPAARGGTSGAGRPTPRPQPQRRSGSAAKRGPGSKKKRR